MRAKARGFEVAPNTGLQGLTEAAEYRRAFSASLLGELHREPLHLDEGYAVLRDLKAGELHDDAARKRLERSPLGVWTAMDPSSQVWVAVEGGSRPLAMAHRVGQQVPQGLAPGCVALLLRDGLQDDGTALLTHCGPWRPPERRQATGPRPKPRWLPRPALHDAPVVQAYRRRRRVGGTHRVGFGHPMGH